MAKYDNYVKMLNAIRNSASERFSNAIPSADGTVDNLKTIGTQIVNNQAFANEWLDALYNRIAFTRLITMDGWKNPLREFKRRLEYGESYLEVAQRLIKSHVRDYEYAKEHFMDINTPAVSSALFHINSERFYPVSVLPLELRKAFLSYEALAEFVDAVVNNLYRSMEYDEFLAMKYCIVRAISTGAMTAREIPTVSAVNAREIVSRIKAVSNKMEFLNTQYNQAQMETYAEKKDQFLLMNADFNALVDTSVLAVSFNMSLAEFMGQQRLVDSFGNLDVDRLDVLFANDPLYTTPTQEELEAFAKIPCVLISRDWFVCFDQVTEMYSNENGMGPYRNYNLHCSRIYSFSPFMPACYFVEGTQSVTLVTVNPAEIEMSRGDIKTVKATVTTVNLADPSVVWSISVDDATVDASDYYTLDTIDYQTVAVRQIKAWTGSNITEATLTATSVFDNSKTAEVTITEG